MKLSIPVGLGELYDKISILEIKTERISDEAKLAHVRDELSLLKQIAVPFPIATELYAELKDVNTRLWDVEDSLRVEDGRKNFGPEFILLARSVYGMNDHRAAIKRKINLESGSAIVEEKSYKG